MDEFFTGVEGLDISVLDKIDKKDGVLSVEDNKIPTEEDFLKDKEQESKGTEPTESKEPKEPVDENKEKEPKKIVEPAKSTKSDEKASESAYRVFAQVLTSGGSIKEIPDDFQESNEGINSLVEKEVESRKQEWIESLPDDVKYFVENYKQGVPFSDFLQAESTIQDYESIDSDKLKDNEGLQKSVITDFLTTQAWTKEEIINEVNEIEAAGTLESKAKRYLNRLVQDSKTQRDELKEQAQDAQRQTIEKYKAQVESLRKTLKEKQEIIPGMKLSDKDRKTMFDGITKFDSGNKNAYMRFKEKNPDIDLTSVYMALVLNNDFSKLDKLALTKATKKLKEGLEETNDKKSLEGIDMTIVTNALNAINF